MTDKTQEILALIELKQFLGWEYYDRLNLKTLEPLRLEVQTRINEITQKAKKSNYTRIEAEK